MKTRLFFIRHGITAWNIKKRYCGFYDVSLSLQGKQQVRLLRPRIRKEKFIAVYSSDRKRALETTRILFGARKARILPELREIHFGIFEGLTHEQILARYPLLYRKWLRRPFRTAIPQGEKLTDFRKRVVQAVEMILRENPAGDIAVICHGGVISAFFTHLKQDREFWKHIPKAASLSIVECARSRLRIRTQNDTSHYNE